MSNIQKAYYKINKEIQLFKQEGVSFAWNNSDLSSILIADFIADYLSNKKINNINLFTILKYKFYAFRQRLKYIKHKENKNNTILIFFNSNSQWQNIEPVYEKLVEKDFKIHIISTKLNLLINLNNEVLSTELIIGFLNEKLNFKNGIQGNAIIKKIQTSLPKISYLYKAFNRILNQSNYKYILIGNCSTSEGKLLETIALQKNIRTGSIQHGSMNRSNPIHGLSMVDDFYVYGEQPKQELIILGKKQKEIIVSGWPIQEEFKKTLEKIKNKNSNIEKADVLICLSGQGHSVSIQHHLDIIDMIAKLQKNLDLKLILKLHPKDNIEYYQKLNKSKTVIYNDDELIKIGSSLIELFTKVNVTITAASTAALESLLTETPVITIDLLKAFNNIDFINDGLTYHTTNYDELKDVYKRISSKENKKLPAEIRKNIEKYYFNYFMENVSPAKIIANRIEKICVE